MVVEYIKKFSLKKDICLESEERNSLEVHWY